MALAFARHAEAEDFQATFEIRAVEDGYEVQRWGKIPEDKAGFVLQTDKGGFKWLVSPERLMSNEDIASAKVIDTAPDELGRSWPVIEITFTEAGQKRWLELAKERHEKSIGVLLNGRLIQAATIRTKQPLKRLEILREVSDRDTLEKLATSLERR